MLWSFWKSEKYWTSASWLSKSHARIMLKLISNCHPCVMTENMGTIKWWFCPLLVALVCHQYGFMAVRCGLQIQHVKFVAITRANIGAKGMWITINCTQYFGLFHSTNETQCHWELCGEVSGNFQTCLCWITARNYSWWQDVNISISMWTYLLFM